jgi:polyphenol oxidase
VLSNDGTKTRDLMCDYRVSGKLCHPTGEDRPDADAIVSNQVGLVLAVQVADCVPILLADKKGGAVGAVHAGWRGTKEAIVDKVMDAMSHEFGTNPADLIVAIGPSIGACCYEVGDDVFEAFRDSRWAGRDCAQWFSRTDTGSLRLNLWAATRDQLRDAGVPPNQIHAAHLCTQTHSDVFESFRAAGAGAGRMAAMIRVQS